MIKARDLAKVTWQYYCSLYEQTIKDMDRYIQDLAEEGYYHTIYSFSNYQQASFIMKYCEKLGYNCTIKQDLEKELWQVKISWEYLL